MENLEKFEKLNQLKKHRTEGVVAVNFTLDREAYEVLRAQAPTRKGYGRFLSRLLYEHQVRKEERARFAMEGQHEVAMAK